MLILISPAKTLDYQSPLTTTRYTLPELLDNAQQLIHEARKLTPPQISSLMRISDKLAGINAARFHDWQPNFTPENARQAILAFKGDVYTGLQAETFSEDDFDFAQQHLRMLSGLYGVLRPLDLMQPYRLEMGIRLENARGKDLYQFWGDIITNKLNEALAAQGDNVVINLASDEYFKSVKPKKLNAEIIKPVFLDEKNGKFKIISFYAKKARGPEGDLPSASLLLHHRNGLRFIGKVWINSRRAETQQHGEVVRITGAGGFYDDVGIATQALLDKTGLDRANRHRSRNRQAIFSDIPVGEHQQHGAATYHFFGFVTQFFHRRFERGFSDVKGDIQRICAVVILFHRRELFEIGVEQNRRFKA